MAFDKYPEDLTVDEQEKFHQAVDKFESRVDNTEEGRCWLPLVPLEETFQTYFFGYKNLQHAAMILNGPIRDPARKYSKIITLCPHVECCNPEHIFLVNKRNNLVDTLDEVLGANEEAWASLRQQVRYYEKQRLEKMRQLESKMATPGLPPNTLRAAARLHAELSRQVDWAFNNAVFNYLGRETHTDEEEKFFLYLSSQGLLTAYAELSKTWKEAISSLLTCPYTGRIFAFYNDILIFVARASGARRLQDRLRSLGLEVTDEDYTI